MGETYPGLLIPNKSYTFISSPKGNDPESILSGGDGCGSWLDGDDDDAFDDAGDLEPFLIGVGGSDGSGVGNFDGSDGSGVGILDGSNVGIGDGL